MQGTNWREFSCWWRGSFFLCVVFEVNYVWVSRAGERREASTKQLAKSKYFPFSCLIFLLPSGSFCSQVFVQIIFVLVKTGLLFSVLFWSNYKWVSRAGSLRRPRLEIITKQLAKSKHFPPSCLIFVLPWMPSVSFCPQLFVLVPCKLKNFYQKNCGKSW